MDVKKEINEKNVLVRIKGRVYTNTSPLVENEITDIEKYENLVFDFEGVEYISSAGLRVLLSAQKRMNKVGGNMVIKNATQTVKDVFEVTGFIDILTIK